MAAAAASSAGAQTPPSERELRIYAGLHDAAARGDVAEIEQLIAEGEKPNIQDGNSRTPLHVAAFLRKHAAARALLRLGANPNALDAAALRHLDDRRGQHDLEMLKIALDGGGKPAQSPARIRHRADRGRPSRPPRGRARVDRGQGAAQSRQQSRLDRPAGGGRARQWRSNHTAIVEALVKAGADVNVPDRHGTTALRHARTRGYSQIARILENAGGR